jgi:DNA N-6-adenine-methyltransferase (Dam)
MNIQHSSATDQWYTPTDILDRVRTVLSPIDLDPASDAYGNERVRAAEYFTAEQDGLAQVWSGTVFLNPPGGKIPKGEKSGGKSKGKLFWEKLLAERDADRIRHAIFLAFSIEALQNTQTKAFPYGIAAFPVCIPAQRIHFHLPGFHLPGSAKDSPSHANGIVYVPSAIDKTHLFVKTFSPIGACVRAVPL